MITREWRKKLAPTTLHIAVANQQNEQVAQLLQQGADINAVTHEGLTALHISVHYGNRETTKILLQHQPAIDAVSAEGFTPLQLAASLGKKEAVSLLLETNVDPFKKNHGMTAKDFARMHGYTEVADMLPGDGWFAYKVKNLFRDQYGCQSWLTLRMATLGYNNKKGVCEGVVGAVMNSFLSSDMATYLDREQLIKDISVDVMSEYATLSQSIIDKLAANPRQTLTDDEQYVRQEIVDINAYFYSIMIYQSTAFYSYLLQWQQRLRAIIAGQSFPLATTLVQPNALRDELGGSYAIGDFSTAYTPQDLKNLFDLLQEAFKDASFPVAFPLTSIDHAIFAGYDPAKNSWTLIDANDPDSSSEPRTSTQIAIDVQFAFSKKSSNEAVVFSGTAFVAGNHKNDATQRFTSLQQNKQWQQLHKITFNKANTVDAYGGSWYAIAFKQGVPFGKSLALGILSFIKRRWKLILAAGILLAIVAAVSALTLGVVPFTALLLGGLTSLGCGSLAASALSAGITYASVGALAYTSSAILSELCFAGISANEYRMRMNEKKIPPLANTRQINTTLSEQTPLLDSGVQLPPSPALVRSKKTDAGKVSKVSVFHQSNEPTPIKSSHQVLRKHIKRT